MGDGMADMVAVTVGCTVMGTAVGMDIMEGIDVIIIMITTMAIMGQDMDTAGMAMGMILIIMAFQCIITLIQRTTLIQRQLST